MLFKDAAMCKELRIAKPQAADGVKPVVNHEVYIDLQNMSIAVSTTPVTQHCGMPFRYAATGKKLRITKLQAAERVGVGEPAVHHMVYRPTKIRALRFRQRRRLSIAICFLEMRLQARNLESQNRKP